MTWAAEAGTLASFVERIAALKRYLKFLLAGSFFATVEEFLTVAVLKRDLGAYLFTLIVLFPAFLTLVYFSSRLLDRLARSEPARELIHFFYGLFGLMLEWFAIGLSPWSDPNANPVVMTVFQLGMFSFWATVGFAPRLFVSAQPLSRKTARAILWFYVPFFGLACPIGLLAPASVKFFAIIGPVVLAYLVLDLFYLSYFVRLFQGQRGSGEATPPGPQKPA